MKKIKFILSLLLIAFLVLFGANLLTKKNKSPGTSFLVKELLVDINKDNLADKIELHGTKDSVDSDYYNFLDLTITDGNSQMKRKYHASNLSGTNPTLELYEFTGSGCLEIFLTIEQNDHLLAEILNADESILKPLLQETGSTGVRLNLSFGANYVLNGSFPNGQNLAVNILHVKPSLLSYGLYDENGNSKNKDTPTVTPFTSLIAMDIENDGIYELCGTQTVKTKNSNLPLCNIVSIHKYNNGFKVTDIKYTR